MDFSSFVQYFNYSVLGNSGTPALLPAVHTSRAKNSVQYCLFRGFNYRFIGNVDMIVRDALKIDKAAL
jgi:hypothetical protein